MPLCSQSCGALPLSIPAGTPTPCGLPGFLSGRRAAPSSCHTGEFSCLPSCASLSVRLPTQTRVWLVPPW